jgi:hypothetical protein
MLSWSQKIEARTSRGISTRNFLGQVAVSRYAATLFIVALSTGHSDITRFSSWSPIATWNLLDLAEKNPKVVQTSGTVDVFDPRSGISGSSARVPTPHNRSQHIQANTTRDFVQSVLLTMGIMMPETCWVNLLWINIYTCVICGPFFFYVNEARSHEPEDHTSSLSKLVSR